MHQKCFPFSSSSFQIIITIREAERSKNKHTQIFQDKSHKIAINYATILEMFYYLCSVYVSSINFLPLKIRERWKKRTTITLNYSHRRRRRKSILLQWKSIFQNSSSPLHFLTTIHQIVFFLIFHFRNIYSNKTRDISAHTYTTILYAYIYIYI